MCGQDKLQENHNFKSILFSIVLNLLSFSESGF